MFQVTSPIGQSHRLPKPTAHFGQQTGQMQPALPAAKPDTVEFGKRPKKKPDLCDKYDIDPERVPVFPYTAQLVVDKRTMINKILKAHRKARKLSILKNLSGRYFGCSVLLENGTWGTAVNFEMDQDAVRLCAERSSVICALNDALDKVPLKKLEELAKNDPEQLKKIKEGLRVKLLVFSEGLRHTESSFESCSDCLTWMPSFDYFSPNTQLARLGTIGGDPDSLALDISSVEAHLPLMDWWKTPSKTNLPIASLQKGETTLDAQQAIQHHKVAKRSADRTNLTHGMAIALLAAAKEAYDLNKGDTILDRNRVAAAILTTDGRIIPSERFDWSSSRFTYPADMRAIDRAFAENPNPARNFGIIAIAYYGNDPRVPKVTSLGQLSQGRGSLDTVLIKIQNDKIDMRTVRDCMPYAFDTTVTPV